MSPSIQGVSKTAEILPLPVSRVHADSERDERSTSAEGLARARGVEFRCDHVARPAILGTASVLAAAQRSLPEPRAAFRCERQSGTTAAATNGVSAGANCSRRDAATLAMHKPARPAGQRTAARRLLARVGRRRPSTSRLLRHCRIIVCFFTATTRTLNLIPTHQWQKVTVTTRVRLRSVPTRSAWASRIHSGDAEMYGLRGFRSPVRARDDSYSHLKLPTFICAGVSIAISYSK